MEYFKKIKKNVCSVIFSNKISLIKWFMSTDLKYLHE